MAAIQHDRHLRHTEEALAALEAAGFVADETASRTPQAAFRRGDLVFVAFGLAQFHLYAADGHKLDSGRLHPEAVRRMLKGRAEPE